MFKKKEKDICFAWNYLEGCQQRKLRRKTQSRGGEGSEVV
jgi:hypothetical protein